MVQAYGARCSDWLGYFGVHTWIAVKPARASAYTVYEVIDWRLRHSGSAVAIRKRVLDVLGLLASGVEGLEVNVLGLAFDVDPFSRRSGCRS